MEKFYKKFAFNFSDVGMALLVLISLWLNANVNAQAPTFNSTPVTNATAGTPYNYSLFATDPGNNNITFTAPTLPSWLSFSASGQNTPTEFGMTLANPGGIVQDDDGNTYITSFSDTKIYKITPDGNSSVWANRGTGTVLSLMIHDGFMYVPYYTGGTSGLTRIAMNNPAAGESSIYSAAKIISLAQKDGYLYCASYGSGKLVRIRISDFQATDLATTGTGLLGGPFGVAFDSEGKLLIASWNGQRLQRWDGVTFTTLPITFTGNLSDVKVDRAGYVYVSVYGNSTILKFTPDLSSSVTVASNMSTYSMTLSSNGTLVFGNRLDSKQYRLQTGAVLTGTPTQAHIGTHNVKITADNGTQTTDQEFTITVKGAPTVGSFADISKSIGDANFSLTAPSSNSAGAFTYTSSNIGVATISGNMVTITGAGTTTITATQAADGFYDGASVTATLTVGIKPPGNALTFDGSGDFVQIGNANTFDARNMKTIEAWVKFNDLVNEQEIISKSTSSNGLELIIYNRQLAVFAMGGGLDRHVDYPTSNLVANRWYHVAATHNGANSALTLYLNGVVVGTAQTPTGMTNSADPLHLGKWNDPYSNRYFKGSLDEVRIWNVQLTQAQIQAGMYQEIDPATAGLQAYYKFSEGIADGNNTAITTTLDATANTRNGILNGFTKTGSASNYTESYALVAPVLQDAADITGEGFTAKWQTPITGVVDNYLLDVSESSNFSSFVPGYLNKDVGNVNEFAVTGLTANRTYYFRVRANKTSVNTQGTYSNVKTATTTKSNQTITFADLTAKTYGDAAFTLSATSTSGLAVTFESSDETIASVLGTTVTIKKAGTVNIIAKQVGNNLYNAATNVTKQLVINKAPLTVTAQNATKTYNKVVYTGGNGISYAGFITGDNAVNSVTGTVVYGGNSQNAINAANNYTIIPSGLSSTNYVITYVNGTLTINKAALTITAKAASKTYDKIPYVGGNGVDYTGFITGDNATNSITGTVVYGGTSQNAVNVANNYTIIPSGLSASNYEITYANGTLAINKATLTVTAKNDSKTYDKVAYTGGNGIDYTGFITGDDAANSVTGTVAYTGTSQNAINVAGNYTIIPSGLNSLNYAITYVNGTLAINKATLTVTAQNTTKTYDKIAYTGGNNITYSGFISGDNVANSVTGTIVYSGTSQGAVAANTYTIIPSGLSSANYTLTYVNGTLTINKAALTVTAQNGVKTYNGLPYTGGNGVTYAGFIAGDNETNSVTGTVNYGGTSQNAINANSYIITPSGLSSANYNVSYVNGTLTVNKAALVAIADNKTRCFGLVNPTFTVRYTGFVNNETANVLTTAPTVATTATANSAAGNYTLTVAGGTAPNYTITYQNGQLTIYALPVINIAAGKMEISRGDQIQLVASGGTNYSWASANGIIAGQNGATLTVRPSLTTTYQVTVTNANGCTDTKSITIEVIEDFKITGTNLLTPNGDGYNDFFVLGNIDLYPNNVVKVFDKAGRLVYSKVKYDNTWDGTFNGNPLAEGTYYYIVDFGKGNAVKKGFISIVRNGK